MTTPEHTLIGIQLAMATGRERVWGWQAVALAGLMSNAPDWDGLPMLVDMARFERGHRVWGHNVFAILFTAFVVAVVVSRRDWIGTCGKWLARRCGSRGHSHPASVAATAAAAGRLTIRDRPLCFLPAFVTGCVAQLIHLPCDVVVSGGHGLTDWEVRPWWPVSNVGYVYPMIPWGDVGPTLILMAGAIAIARRGWGRGTATPAAATLAALLLYLIGRRLMS